MTNAFQKSGSTLTLLMPEYDENGLPDPQSLIALYHKVHTLMASGKVLSAYTPAYGGVAEAVYKMAIGNGFGFRFEETLDMDTVFGYRYGGFLLETAESTDGIKIGTVTHDGVFQYGNTSLKNLETLYEGRLEGVYPVKEQTVVHTLTTFSFPETARKAPAILTARPKVLIPVFPGTNCEYDTAKVMADAGAETEIFVINNLTGDGILHSVDSFSKALQQSQMVFLPGGFSGGDEPDGSGKFILAFFQNEAVKQEVHRLLQDRDGLMCGICNGFQALIKLGLLPYGKIIDTDANCPTLTYNTIARHQSKLVRIRVASNKSPWLAETKVGDIYTVPISHGEGRFLAPEALIHTLAENGQIATQYVDENGCATDDIRYNPNNSMFAIEGITSPDGRVFGKMGHSERIGTNLYRNVCGNFDMKLFTSAVKYFKGKE